MATTITDAQLRELLGTTQPFTVALLRWGPKRHMDGVEAIRWEHTRRMASLRADGLMPIVCPFDPMRSNLEQRREDPVGTGNLVAVGVFNLSPEQVSEVMEGDPCVQAGVFVYEVHLCRSFPGDALPA